MGGRLLLMVYLIMTVVHYQLDLITHTWKELSVGTPDGPRAKSGCGVVVHGEEVVVLDGYSDSPGPIQPGAECVGGFTNEIHSYNLKSGEGVWSGA